MEKAMSVEEKIRRAEEIYNRRNGNNYIYESKAKSKKSQSFTNRMIKQIILCFIIYGVFYVVTNRQYFLSEEFQANIEEIASQNETLNKAYTNVKSCIQKYLPNILNNNNQSNEDDKSNLENTLEENEINVEDVNNITENNIGGAEENITVEQSSNQKSQEEIDSESIKNTISFINPIEGTISSTFGWRSPTTSTVPKYHTGLDIAASTGTVIKSATDGEVILASSEGDYGNHYKIQIDDVTIIYAHCSKLYLQEGDTVVQGQEIAEVGSTGNSTRTTSAF